MNVTTGVQLGLADDLINELLAEVHALGLLDIKLTQQLDPFDGAELTMPTMVSGNTGDGSMRLVLGDMVATLGEHGQPVLDAAVNAQVDLSIEPGTSPQEIALQLGKVHVFVNIPDGDASTAATTAARLAEPFLITVPVPSVAGVSFDNLSLRGDSGYVVVSGQIH